MHDLYARVQRQSGDTLHHNSEITALSVRPDGRELCTATMKGEVLLWDISDANIIGTMDVDRDI
jgi:periodic tryptophan protein 2